MLIFLLLSITLSKEIQAESSVNDQVCDPLVSSLKKIQEQAAPEDSGPRCFLEIVPKFHTALTRMIAGLEKPGNKNRYDVLPAKLEAIRVFTRKVISAAGSGDTTDDKEIGADVVSLLQEMINLHPYLVTSLSDEDHYFLWITNSLWQFSRDVMSCIDNQPIRPTQVFDPSGCLRVSADKAFKALPTDLTDEAKHTLATINRLLEKISSGDGTGADVARLDQALKEFLVINQDSGMTQVKEVLTKFEIDMKGCTEDNPLGKDTNKKPDDKAQPSVKPATPDPVLSQNAAARRATKCIRDTINKAGRDVFQPLKDLRDVMKAITGDAPSDIIKALQKLISSLDGGELDGKKLLQDIKDVLAVVAPEFGGNVLGALGQLKVDLEKCLKI